MSLVHGAIKVDGVTKVYRLGEPRSVFSWKALPALLRRPDRGRLLTALEDVSFQVQPGEAVALIGANGTGKSTLLRILSGITAATRGRALAGGRLAGVLELGSGFYDELTALDNTFLNAQLLGMSRRQVKQQLDSIFAFAELEDFMHAPMGQFSFGMRLRLAFSIAMALEPAILLLDEVMGVGDLKFQRRSAAKIKELAARGATLVVVSHHLSDLAMVCSRGLLLRRGRLVADAPIQQAIDAYLEEGAREPAAPNAAAAPAVPQPEGAAAQILAVRVLNEAGGEQREYRVGEALTLAVRFEAPSPLDRPVFALAIYREDGLYLSQTSTDASGFHTGRIAGAGEMRFTWVCPFNKGSYRVSAMLLDSTGKVVLAQAPAAATFEILPRGGFEQGAVRIEGQWSNMRG
jgi:ABC-type polysaccharide/polyol phosphate transport system ATPase subunit